MEYIISEKRLFSVILKWLRKEFPNLKREDIGPNIIFSESDGNIIFLYKKKPMELFISSDDSRIHFSLMDFFKLNEKQIHKVIKLWVKKDYRLPVKDVIIRKRFKSN
jgi:hypothetical protein